MKNIGLITYYGENYGGMLQAYALQRVVNNHNYNCKIISNDFLYMPNSKTRFSMYAKKMLYVITHLPSYLKRRRQVRKFLAENKQKSAKFQDFLEKYIKIDKTGYVNYEQYINDPPIYDVYLCGSDQIWNPNLYSENGFYFAGFAPKKAVKISYASSIGVSNVTKKQADFMRPLLKELDIISTREAEGVEIVSKVSGKHARNVLDPTLLLTADEWLEVACVTKEKEPYIFAYLFGERDYVENVKNQVKQLTGMRVVCIPYVSREFASDDTKVFDAGPSEFIGLIKGASLVLTDSFHATAFSLNFKIPFVSLCRFSKDDPKGMNSRLYTILNSVGLESRIIDEDRVLTKEFLFDVDFDSAHKLLSQKREENTNFLIESLEFKKEK